MMKWMTLVFAALFACAVNMSPAMADDDDHGDKYKQHESKQGDGNKYKNKHDDERDNDHKNKYDDESKGAENERHNSASSMDADEQGNMNKKAVNENSSKWWPF